MSGLIGQRSRGNVVVRGVNDVVTQDTPVSAAVMSQYIGSTPNPRFGVLFLAPGRSLPGQASV